MAGVQSPSAVLLLKDGLGEKVGSLLTGFRKKKDQNVLRGSLLLSTTSKDTPNTLDGKPTHNYRVCNEDITMYCSEQDVAPLTEYEYRMLSGIKSPGARYEAFINDILDWGSKLKVNDVVYVTLPSQQAIAKQRCQAIIRWIGILPSEEGVKFGVEILEEEHLGAGYTNGVFRGQQLFTCDSECGMFVSLEKLAFSPDFLTQAPYLAQPSTGGTSSSRLGSGKPANTHSRSLFSKATNSGTGQGPSASTRSKTHKKSPCQFTKDDRVVIYNKDQIGIHGTVRWIGEAYTDDGKVNVVGIETDVSVQKEDFLITMTGLHHNFKCVSPKHGKVVLPESLVQSEVDVIKEKDKKKLEILSQQHENSHRGIGQNERDMLRDAKIEPQALNLDEQEKILRECNQQQDKKFKSKKLESTSQPNAPNLHCTPQQPLSNELTKNTTDHEKNHHYEEIPLPRSSSAGNLLRQQSQSNNSANSLFEQKAMLRETNIDTQTFDRSEQQRLFQEYKQQHNEQRKAETGGAQNFSSSNISQFENDSSVDPPSKHHPSSSSTYQNIPGANNTQPPQRAFAPSQGVVEHNFRMNSRVQFSDPPRYGVIRWMGDLPEVKGLIAGVELEEDLEGCTDGTWHGTKYFHCKFGRGFFSPLSNFKPGEHGIASSQQTSNTPPVYREPTALPRGSAVPTPGMYREPTQAPITYRPTDITVGSAVEIGDPQDPHRGVVQWIGTFPGTDEIAVGIELEKYSAQCGDGTINGVQYFECPYGHALFCPLTQVRPDQRFADSAPPRGLALTSDNPLQEPLEEFEDQQVPPLTIYVGDKRGIQGHQNSCYLDSTLFGLFALSDIFDEMFLEVFTNPTTDLNRKAVSEMLWKGIVNPLRRNGVVRYESVMMMRNKLDELGKMEGITEKEKDPEEFLNMLFKHVLQVPAFISIRRPFGVEKEFFVQLFVEHDPNLRVPTVGELLKRMFKEQQISFRKIPPKLLLQVPRFGREFKTYNKIIPDLKLDILELTDSAIVPDCMFCGERSSQKCPECIDEFPNANDDGFVFLCSTCSSSAHKKKTRTHHKLHDTMDTGKLELYKLDLLSVICIETSHYVCFTRDFNTDKWIFFDSMANRVYDTYNIPKVTDCTHELNEWVYSGDRTKLMSTQPRQLPELVRRFTQDIYMCVYIQPDVAMYGDGNEEDSYK